MSTFFFHSFNSYSQSSIYISGNPGISEFASKLSLEEKPTIIKGSPYYNLDFMYGEVETYRGSNFNGLFRYNIYNEEMEFIYKRDTFMIDNPIILKYIKFAAKTFTYSVIIDKFWQSKYIYGGYFEVLNEGPCQLLIRYEMDFRQNRFVPYYGGGGGDGSYRYIPEQKYYLRLDIDEPAFRLKNNKRFFYKTFPEKKTEIAQFLKEHHLNLKQKNDLITLFQFINSL